MITITGSEAEATHTVHAADTHTRDTRSHGTTAAGVSCERARVYTVAIVYVSEDPCTELRSEINHSASVGVYSRADVQSLFEAFTGANCANDFTRPAEQLRVRLQLQRYSGAIWQVCTETTYMYNQMPSDNILQNRNFPARPCGPGTYRTMAIGSLYYNGSWLGGSLSSGNHSF